MKVFILKMCIPAQINNVFSSRIIAKSQRGLNYLPIFCNFNQDLFESYSVKLKICSTIYSINCKKIVDKIFERKSVRKVDKSA